MAKKVILRDLNDNKILPITRGELVLDSSGMLAFHSNEFLATTSQPGLMSSEDKYKIDNIEGIGNIANDKVSQVNTTTSDVYRLLFSETADDETRTEGARKSAKLTFNPSTGVLQTSGLIGNIDGTYVNKLTGYTKATAISALAATDTLNTALGKLEYKADVAYNLVKGAYDGDGTIENLEEILKVLEGIKDTSTIQQILGNYILKTDTIDWSKIINTPTTLAGYGITDALPLSGGGVTGRITAPIMQSGSFQYDAYVNYGAVSGSNSANWYTVYSCDVDINGDCVTLHLTHSYYYLRTDSVTLVINIGYSHDANIVQIGYNSEGSRAFQAVRVRVVNAEKAYIDVYIWNNVPNTDIFFVNGTGRGVFQAPTLASSDGNVASELSLVAGCTAVQKDIVVGGHSVIHTDNISDYALSKTGGEITGSLGVTGNISAQGNITTSYGSFVGNLSGTASYATSAGNADTLDGRDGSEYTYHVEGESSTANRYIRLAILPKSADYTNDSVTIIGTIGGWEAAYKSSLHITVGRRSGVVFKGYSYPRNQWDICVNDYGEVLIYFERQYSTWDLSVTCHQATFNYNANVTPIDTNFNKMSDSSNVVWFNDDGSVTKITPRTIWGQSFDGSGDITKTSIGTMRYLYFSSSDGTYNTGYVGRGSSDDSMQLMNYKYAPLDLGVNSSVNMRINSNGNVLIGTTTDSGQKLQVNGDSYVNGTLSVSGVASNPLAPAIIFSSYGETFDGRGNFYMSGQSGDWNVCDQTIDRVLLRVKRDTGNVLVGTTTDSGYKLYVNGDGCVNGTVTATGFKTPTGTDDSVLLAGGGTKALSSLAQSSYLKINDIRSTNHLPNASVYPDYSLTAWFNNTGTPTNAWYSGITLKGWTSGYTAWQLAGYSDTGAHYNLYYRPLSTGSNNSWAEWEKLLTNKPTATVYSGTANLSSYWCKVASVTIPCSYVDYNATIVATRTHEANDIAIIHWNCRTNGSATATPNGTLIYTGTCGIGESFRSYNSGAGNTTTFELWVNGGGLWLGWQFTVLSETNRGGSVYRAALWYNTSFSTVQTPTYSNYITASQKTPNPSDYYWANIKVSSASNSSTSPTFSHAIFNRVSDHGINVGTIRGMKVGSLTGEFIHMYERVHIGSPSGWGSLDAPSYGLSTYGGAWFAVSTGSVGIGNTNPSYKLHVSGDSYTTGWSRAANGFHIEDTGVHFTHQGTLGEIDMTSNNEFLWGSSSADLYFNYRAVSRGTTVTTYRWHAGSSTSYANHVLGKVKAQSTASSWLEGQRYERGGFNLMDATDTGSYWPWMRQTNTGSSKWFSMGVLGTSLYFIGSTTSRTENGYDYGFRMDFSNGYLYGNFSGYLSGTAYSAEAIKDSNNGTRITACYSTGGFSSNPSWLAAWNGYHLTYVSPSVLSVNYANSAGTADRASYLSGHSSSPDNSHPGHGARIFYSWNIGSAGNSTSGYSNGITIGSHPNDTAYGFQIVQNMWDDTLYVRRYNSGWQSWKAVSYTDHGHRITKLHRRDDSSDYSLQHHWTGTYWYLRGYSGDSYHAGVQVAYADNSGYASSAGNADTVDGVHLEWAGSLAASNTSWIAGWTNDGTKLKAVSQSSLSVSYANSSGSAASLSGGSIATWGTLTAANGYTNVCTWDTGNTTGAFSLAGKGGQMSLQLDGFFYQNEGKYLVLDTNNYSSTLNSVYAPKAITDNLTNFNVGLTDGYINNFKSDSISLSNTSVQITRAGAGVSWYQGRQYAMLKTTSYTGYGPVISMKTSTGDWSLGVYSDDYAYLTFITDTNYNNSTNSTTYQLKFPKANGTLATTSDLGSYLPLSGGTMTGTIITPGDDSVVIKPAKNNYDQIGASDCVFWKIHATTFIGSLSGNASSASKLNTNNGTNVKPVYFSGGVPVTCSYEIGCVKAAASTSATNKYLLGVTAAGYLWAYYHTAAYVNSNGVFWSSDRRLKDNIKSPVKNGMLNDETGLIRKFTWKDSGNASYGFIAQELMLHIPEAVDYDETLNKYSVNYDVAHSALIAQLVIKVKELESEISKLKQLIN